MILCSENNWYNWRYDTGPINGRRDSEHQQLVTTYSKYGGKIGSFKEELIKAARSTVDHYPGLRPSVFFSGGVDSELVLRAYVDGGLNPDVYIVRYEDDLNLYDVSYAVAIATSLNLKFRIIDFNLRRFYENDAIQVAEDAQIDRPRMLPHLKFTENVDGLVIVGHSDIAWYRPHDNYDVKAEWIARDYEHDLGCDKYNILHNRPAVYQWWKWTPGLVISYTRLKWFQSLINDEIYGKLGINSTKLYGFREAYKDLLFREKQTGFERIDPLIAEVEQALEKRFGSLKYRAHTDRTYSQIVGDILGA